MDSTCVDISRLIPHRGAMCLLDRVENWDKDHIVCRTTSHRRPDNPLRDDSGRLRGFAKLTRDLSERKQAENLAADGAQRDQMLEAERTARIDNRSAYWQ